MIGFWISQLLSSISKGNYWMRDQTLGKLRPFLVSYIIYSERVMLTGLNGHALKPKQLLLNKMNKIKICIFYEHSTNWPLCGISGTAPSGCWILQCATMTTVSDDSPQERITLWKRWQEKGWRNVVPNIMCNKMEETEDEDEAGDFSFSEIRNVEWGTMGIIGWWGRRDAKLIYLYCCWWHNLPSAGTNSILLSTRGRGPDEWRGRLQWRKERDETT